MFVATYEFPLILDNNSCITYGMYYKFDMLSYWLDLDGEISFSDLYYGGNPSKEKIL